MIGVKNLTLGDYKEDQFISAVDKKNQARVFLLELTKGIGFSIPVILLFFAFIFLTSKEWKNPLLMWVSKISVYSFLAIFLAAFFSSIIVGLYKFISVIIAAI